uniref:Peptidase S1 domain-containing protein n=1 Tax=Acrobeloides nanus TaxID=290746 RepID=A0A914EG41_9BILA
MAWLSSECTGSIISKFHILTAAHCVYDAYGPVDEMNVTIGTNDITKQKYFYHSSKIWPHNSTRDEKHDIAIIKLDKPINFNKLPNVGPICLLKNFTEISEEIGFIAGYGRIEILSSNGYLEGDGEDIIKDTETTNFLHENIIELQLNQRCSEVNESQTILSSEDMPFEEDRHICAGGATVELL